MPVSKAQQKAVAKYMKENYDEFKVRLPKGYKEQISTLSAAQGQSINAFIRDAIIERICKFED